MPLHAIAGPILRGIVGGGRALAGGAKRAGGWAVANGPGIQGAVDSIVPSHEARISARVWGNPTSKRADLYRLALALVYGAKKRRKANFIGGLLSPPGMIRMSWSGDEKLVEVEVSYKGAGVANLIAAVLGEEDGGLKNAPIFGNIPDSIVGGKPEFFGLIDRQFFPAPPDPPQVGRVITTDQPSYIENGELKPSINPRPPGDLVSRGFLEGLIYDELRQPCCDDALRHPELANNVGAPSSETPGGPNSGTPPDTVIPRMFAVGRAYEQYWIARGFTAPSSVDPVHGSC